MSETTTTTGLPTLTELGDLIRARRTHMFVDKEREVPHALVAELCDLAQWAPNHKRTWPWRFALLEGDARARLGEAIADVMASLGDPEPKVVKTRTKYLRTPALLVLGATPGDSELRTAENRDAGAAGMQNLLLAAAAAGLASYWGSVATGANDVVAELCGFEAGTHIVGIVYLGWPVGTVEVPERPPVEVTFLS
ncbi:MAG: nitroreductase family protein [Ilumatobacteraceae bacterium]